MKRLTRQQAINAKCKDCNYDPCDKGNWRQQVEACWDIDCALWAYRPRSKSLKPNPHTVRSLEEDVPEKVAVEAL